jgi:hypothetical protein
MLSTEYTVRIYYYQNKFHFYCVRYQGAVRLRLAEHPPDLVQFAPASDSFVDLRLQVQAPATFLSMQCTNGV